MNIIDFDFGDEQLIELSNQVRFIWVLSNAWHLPLKEQENPNERLLGCAKSYTIKNVNGRQVGFFGLAGTTARRVAYHLRAQESCDLVIALTHMRLAEDIEVAKATKSGKSRGHDNADITAEGLIRDAQGDIRIIKSGADWTGLLLVRMVVEKDNKGSVDISTIVRQWSNIDAAKLPVATITPEIAQLLDSIHTSRVDALVQEPVLHSYASLDGRGSVTRSQETNLGNMLATTIQAFYDTDIALFNSGSIRCNQLLAPTMPSGSPLLVKDIISKLVRLRKRNVADDSDICPFEKSLLLKSIKDSVILQSMENSVGDMHMDGLFFQIAGLRMVATWQRKNGESRLGNFP
ncbi:5'-nucleotidase [Penicillium angulare]|uniref:5'-nucleotidase n=1 Tax=Penicillium angulare TaxID=116970 RepID=UPI002540BEC8|nr:5'-nucleotidase [Penicillium angulare]KAJ5278730.1 5'-nucleotidase [Penicillium angulare]